MHLLGGACAPVCWVTMLSDTWKEFSVNSGPPQPSDFPRPGPQRLRASGADVSSRSGQWDAGTPPVPEHRSQGPQRPSLPTSVDTARRKRRHLSVLLGLECLGHCPSSADVTRSRFAYSGGVPRIRPQPPPLSPQTPRYLESRLCIRRPLPNRNPVLRGERSATV